MSGEFVVRIIGMVLFGFVGWWLGTTVAGDESSAGYMRWILAMTLAGAALGVLLTPYITTRPYAWARRQLRQVPAADLFSGTVGLTLGLIVAALLALPLSMLPGVFGKLTPIVAAVLFGYLGVAVMVMRERELFNIFGGLRSHSEGTRAGAIQTADQVILDTSAIIDGRVADISRTGFIHGTVVIPRFVLNELQHIADSPDILRRNRGRRGLDMLNKLQKESDVPVQISEVDVDDVTEVDGKLVKLAKKLRCPVITNDYNLNRVAELQGVRVLNINELANAVKSVVLPGEEMAVRIIQEGKEVGQGVGYLDDGTMVVVEGGRRYLNSQLEITVTRVLQTVAGRMIFAHPKNGAYDAR